MLVAGACSATHNRRRGFRALVRSGHVPHVPAHRTKGTLRLESRHRDEGVWRSAPRTTDVVPSRWQREEPHGIKCRQWGRGALSRLVQRLVGYAGHDLKWLLLRPSSSRCHCSIDSQLSTSSSTLDDATDSSTLEHAQRLFYNGDYARAALVGTTVPRRARWLLGGGNKKRGLLVVAEVVEMGAGSFFVQTEARFALWDMQVRERDLPGAMTSARLLARQFPENRELRRFLTMHDPTALDIPPTRPAP